MSFKLVAAVFDLKVGNPLRKMVLIKLADQANDDGVCWPSYESIAKSCEISRRSVVTHIQWLEDNNFLWIEKRYNAAESKNFSNRYHLTLSKAVQFKKEKVKKVKGGANAAPVQKDGVDAGDALGSATNALGSATNAPSNSAGDAPEPIIKPINESVKEPVISFESFWNAYDYKKGGLTKPSKKWDSLTNNEKLLIMAHIPAYVKSTPVKKFRKHPMTYLNNEGWLDEIDHPHPNQGQNNESNQSANSKPRRETQAEYEQRMQQGFNQEFGVEVQATGNPSSYS